DAGCVEVDGRSTRASESTRAIRTLVGVVAQDPESQIVSSTVLDEVAFGPENLGLPREEIAARVEAAIKAVGLRGKEGREPHGLSGGEKQRLVIAGILAMQPRYMIFDEPSSMLDANGRSEVRAVIDRLHAEGHGILHITHDISECVTADRVVVLSRGKIIFEGQPSELLYNEALFRDKGLVLTPMLALAVRLQNAGMELPKNLNQPAALAASVVGYVEALGGGR
ncbi:MAG: ATP-binding cassette domain-containing protein, partial [Actinobacteria bacterium]|nr:ATP-binding cassette domain-containing protein [Actinomycetota bacterium]